MKAKKVLALVLCAALLVAGSVAATLAYLTFTTDPVVNTFSIGKVEIDLDETDVDVYGVLDGTTRVKKNTYKLIPGHTYTKDPVVHVKAESEVCWLFVKVVDEIAAIQDATTVADQMKANGWSQLKDKDGNDVANVYYHAKVDAREVAVNVPVFESFKIKGDANVAIYDGKTITVTAYAVQADTFENATEAWTAAPSTWTK